MDQKRKPDFESDESCDICKIEERLVHRIGVREWGLPTLVTPGKIWRSKLNKTVSCMVASETPDCVTIETLPLEIIPVGELSVMPMKWRAALWEYCQAWPASGCDYGPFLAISREQRNQFLRKLGQRLVTSDEIGCRSIAGMIGKLSAVGYQLVNEDSDG